MVNKEELKFYNNYKFDWWDMFKKNIHIIFFLGVYVICANLYMDGLNKLSDDILLFIGLIFYIYVTFRLMMRIMNIGNFEAHYKRKIKK